MRLLLLILLISINGKNCQSREYKWETKFYDNLQYNMFKDIDNVDSLDIMAVEMKRKAIRIVKSTDAGMTWDVVFDEELFKDTLIRPQSIAYPTKDYCIVGTNEHWYLVSKDSGKTFKKYRENFNTYLHGLWCISMFDNKDGLMGTYYDVMISHNGFETYELLKIPERGIIWDIYMYKPSSFYVLLANNWDIDKNTNDQIIYKTNDTGKTWGKMVAPPQLVFGSMRFIDSLFGYIIGSRRNMGGEPWHDIIYRTKDGCKSWQLVLDNIIPDNAYNFQNVDILDHKHAIAVGQFGKVYWTHDGGDTWQIDRDTVVEWHIPAVLHSCILGENTALIADFRDRILRSSLIGTDVTEETIKVMSQKIFPNPISSGSKLQIQGIDFIEEVNLLDLTGISTKLEANVNEIKIPSGLAPGFYILQYRAVGNVFREKVIIN